MEITHTLLFFLSFLFIAVLLKPLSEYFHLPFPALLILLGFLSSEYLVNQGVDLGLRWDNFHDLVFYILLPILVYNAALRLNVNYFFKNIVTVLLFAIPLMLLAILVSAYLLFYGINHAAGFPFVAALLTATILSTIDPAAILLILKNRNISPSTMAILEGEGLFSGAMAIVLTGLLVNMIMSSQNSLQLGATVLEFTRVFSGGILVGLGVGLVTWILIRVIKESVLRGILSLISAYSGFLIAEYYLQVSGMIAVLIAGLMLNAFLQKADTSTQNFLRSLWDYKATIANVLLFIVLGMSIQYAVLLSQWFAIMIGIGAALLARLVIVYLGLRVFSFLPNVKQLHACDHFTLFWGSLRGAVTVALVLSLPESLPYYNTIQGIVYGVVLFTLFVQAPSLKAICYWADTKKA